MGLGRFCEPGGSERYACCSTLRICTRWISWAPCMMPRKQHVPNAVGFGASSVSYAGDIEAQKALEQRQNDVLWYLVSAEPAGAI